MPLFKVEIFKEYLNENWGNVYYLRASDLAEAVTGAPIIVTAERAIHLSSTTFVSARVSDTVEGTDAFTTIPLSGLGSYNPGSAPLALWNTLRVDFEADGGGRPSRKYYRGALGESDVNYETVDTTRASNVDTLLTTMITDLAANSTPYVDVDDQDLTNAVVKLKLQMRQLHRKRKKAAA